MTQRNMTRTQFVPAPVIDIAPSPYRDPALQPKLKKAIFEGWSQEFYRKHWNTSSLDEILQRIDAGQFHGLPVVRKQDLRDYWQEIMNFREATDVVSSSGTTGRPVDVPVHYADEQIRILRVRRLLRELGVKQGSRVLQLLSLNDLFTLGPLAWQAIKAEGGVAIRCSPQRLQRIIQEIKYIRPEFVIGNPYVLARMADEAGEAWPDRDLLPKRAFLAVAATFKPNLEPTPVAEAVVKKWGFELVINQYGTSELGPLAHECQQHQGLHIHADHHLIELVDLETGEPVTDPDTPGEVVVTGLTFPRGFQPIRYATGDISAWLRHEPCPCGRTTPRLGPILGRVDHQLKVFGQTVFPDFLLNLADQNPLVYRSAVRARRDKLGSDEVSLLLVPQEGHDAEAIRREVARTVSQNLAVSPNVEVITEAHLQALEQMASQNTNMVKVPRFFDFREEKPVA